MQYYTHLCRCSSFPTASIHPYIKHFSHSLYHHNILIMYIYIHICINIKLLLSVMFNPLITARLFVGYSMSSELREVRTEWTGVCGRPVDSLYCYYSTNCLHSSFPMEWPTTDQKEQKVIVVTAHEISLTYF